AAFNTTEPPSQIWTLFCAALCFVACIMVQKAIKKLNTVFIVLFEMIINVCCWFLKSNCMSYCTGTALIPGLGKPSTISMVISVLLLGYNIGSPGVALEMIYWILTEPSLNVGSGVNVITPFVSSKSNVPLPGITK